MFSLILFLFHTNDLLKYKHGIFIMNIKKYKKHAFREALSKEKCHL